MQRIAPVSPKRITRLLTVAVLALVIASVTGQTVEYFAGTQAFVWLVDLDRERNIPTLFSAGMLALCSALLAKIALDKKRAGASYVVHWTALSAVFLLLALEEVAGVHETAGSRLASSLHLDARGIFHFFWVVPGAAAVLVFVLAYLRFLASLPLRTRQLFLIAGALYVGGALGMEMLGGRHMDLRGFDMTYVTLVTVEELLEMLGAVVFIGALISYMGLRENQAPNPGRS